MEINNKRKEGAVSSALVPIKKSRNDDALVQVPLLKAKRTSHLHAPVMLLTGHEGEVFTAKFSPDGNFIASAGFEQTIFVWSTFGECVNLGILRGHSGAILDLHWNRDGSELYTASTDKTAAVWDMETGARVKRFKGHTAIVNSVGLSRRGTDLVCTASDDGTVKVWDRRRRHALHSFENKYPVLATCFTEGADAVISAGIDNTIKLWDLRRAELDLSLAGHTDSVTGLALSHDGNYLLSNSMDNTLRIWDVRPYCPSPDRLIKTLMGHQHSFEKNLLRCAWSHDGRYVTCGSGDRCVYVWDALSRRLLYKLPGHAGSVNETALHPREPIVLSCGSDKKLYLGELDL